MSYQETRTNCIALDSDLYHTVSWPFLRVWAPDDTGTEQVYQVPIASYATPVAGSYNCAYANFTLSGTLTAGDFVGIAYLENSITYQVGGVSGGGRGSHFGGPGGTTPRMLGGGEVETWGVVP